MTEYHRLAAIKWFSKKSKLLSSRDDMRVDCRAIPRLLLHSTAFYTALVEKYSTADKGVFQQNIVSILNIYFSGQ